LVNPFILKKFPRLPLVGQVEMAMAVGDDVVEPGLLKLADDGRSDHTTMTGNEYFVFRVVDRLDFFSHDDTVGYGKLSGVT